MAIECPKCHTENPSDSEYSKEYASPLTVYQLSVKKKGVNFTDEEWILLQTKKQSECSDYV